jgi:transcriptional regulator with XRE-family HTH domain
MRVDEIKQRKEYFKEFGEILVRRHGQNYCSSYDNNRRVTIDEAAVRFGRYLRAARLSRGLSAAELATQAKISQATQIALEQGAILACDIKPKWLKDLARVLGENVEEFNLLLGREISHNGRWDWLAESGPGQVCNVWSFSLDYILSGRRSFSFIPARVYLLSKPIYATLSALLLFFAIGAILRLGTLSSEQPTIPSQEKPFINVNAEDRLNRVQAESDFERQIFISQADTINRRACCIY